MDGLEHAFLETLGHSVDNEQHLLSADTRHGRNEPPAHGVVEKVRRVFRSRAELGEPEL